MDDAAPALVGPDQPDDCADAAAPRSANPRRAPIGAIMWAAGAPGIVEQSEQNRASNRAAGRALDHTLAGRDSTTHIEPAHRSARNRERSGSARHVETENAPVHRFDGAA